MDIKAPTIASLQLSRPQGPQSLALGQKAIALGNTAKASTPGQIDKAARDLESVFAKMLISSMRQASFGDSLFPEQNTAYRDMYDQQLAKHLSAGKGLGLAPVIARQLGGASGAVDATSLDTGEQPPMLPLPLRTSSASTTIRATQLALGGGRAGVVPAPLNGHAELLDALGTGPDESTGTVTLSGELELAQPLPSAISEPQANTSARPGSPEAFVASIWPQAQRAAQELGVDPKVLVAQAALETGWGKHMVGKARDGSGGNLFGIKAGGHWSGASVTAGTREFVSGQAVRQNARFRSYDSIRQSFDDYVALLKGNNRYADALNAGGDRHRFATALHRAGYATDPHYASKLVAIADGPTLRRALDRLNPAPVLAANDINPRQAASLPNAVET